MPSTAQAALHCDRAHSGGRLGAGSLAALQSVAAPGPAPSGLGRRAFLQALGAGAAGMALASQLRIPPAAAQTAYTAGVIPSLSGLPWASGGYGDITGLTNLRQRPLDVVTTFASTDTWNNMKSLGSPFKKLPPATTYPVYAISYPMFPKEQSPQNGGTAVWQQAANGQFDYQHDAAATSLSSCSQQFILRLGWEWNVVSFPWACMDVALAANYITYFRRIVDLFRARVPGISIHWCCNRGTKANAGAQNFYPGDDWVDFIGVDAYDWYPANTTQSAWDKEYNKTYLGGPKGLGSWLAFATAQGKTLSFGEWAMIGGVAAGGGDNPFFVSQMLNFFQTNAASIGYESYFNCDHSPNIHDLDELPNGAATYQSIMAGIV